MDHLSPTEFDASVTDVVLFSGGWESTLCAVRAKARAGAQPVLLFVNYDQSFLALERKATRAIARHLNMRLYLASAGNIMPRKGDVVEGRNENLMSLAKSLYPRATTVWLGVRAPSPAFDRYGDSNAVWAWRTAQKLGFRRCELPALCMPKHVVKWRVTAFGGVPAHLVFSSEGMTP